MENLQKVCDSLSVDCSILLYIFHGAKINDVLLYMVSEFVLIIIYIPTVTMIPVDNLSDRLKS